MECGELVLEERLQKLLSARGVTSRRAAERLIVEGRVTVNGRRAELGCRANPEDLIFIDGCPLAQAAPRTYLMLYKPRGYVTTLSDEKGRRTVAELVEPCGARVWPVGRLDLDSEGLLIMTDDGSLTQALLHPSHEVEKEYEVWVCGDAVSAIPILSAPMSLDGTPIRPAAVHLIAENTRGAVLSMVIHEGKNRQIRRMCMAAGLSVQRLRRVREGPLGLGNLKPGRWRRLTPEEVTQLQNL